MAPLLTVASTAPSLPPGQVTFVTAKLAVGVVPVQAVLSGWKPTAALVSVLLTDHGSYVAPPEAIR